ncbi:GNAT family N-acetyltransferase [Andreprevotia chitinilytica]|uniref:GNAT family N-acetyltransferase n=1 Tax=Andreprevotia chitinilytica TaxID=396808 RepID=UPI000553F356|nr:GNAT family N-acetyltransferase [Andreprevotia chitinilytica]
MSTLPPFVTPVIELTTARLRLRQWRESDREPFAALNAAPCVMEHFPAPLTRAQSDALADRIETGIAEHGWGLWAVEVLASGEFIGFVGLGIPSAELPCSPCVEIGWRLAAAHWGRGYATEAALAALRVAFETLRLDEVVSFTALPNQRSQAVMARLGMRRDAATFEHPAVAEGSPLRTHCLYRLNRARWANHAS